MKGVFTQIKYIAQGAILREATNTGMVVGLPIATEQRKQILVQDAETDITPGTGLALPIIGIKGDNPAFNYKDGDVLHNMRVWIRKSSEPKSAAVECFLAGAPVYDPTDYADYGDATETLLSFNPIRDKKTSDLKAIWADGLLSFDAVVPDLMSGDTIILSGKVGLISTARTEAGVTVATATWDVEPVTAELTTVTSLYYDYIENPSVKIAEDGTLAPRGYVLYFDSIVYRTSEYGLKAISSGDDISDAYGANALSNPVSNLGMGAFLFMAANGFKNKFRVVALDLRGYTDLSEATPQELMDDPSIWTSALSAVDNIKDVYYLVPLTANEAVHDVYEAYINTSADMYRQREKRLYLAKQIIDSGLTTNEDDIAAAFGNGAWGDADYKAGKHYAEGYDLDGNLTYFNKDVDVEVAQARPMATNNERVTYIGCEYAAIDDINIEGYYISAIIAGWRASMALGYVADDMAVPLITSIPCGQNYYSEDDLDKLASAGWYMLQQEMAGSPVTCYMQMTTAYDSEERREESFIVALDYCMRDIRATTAPFTKGGLENRISRDPAAPVTQRFLRKLNAACANVRYKYTVQNEVFSTMEIVGVRVSEMKKTASEIVVRFQHYYPNREIYVTAYVE